MIVWKLKAFSYLVVKEVRLDQYGHRRQNKGLLLEGYPLAKFSGYGANIAKNEANIYQAPPCLSLFL